MSAGNWKLVELLLTLGAVLAVGLWQLGSLARDARRAKAREAARREREEDA